MSERFGESGDGEGGGFGWDLSFLPKIEDEKDKQITKAPERSKVGVSKRVVESPKDEKTEVPEKVEAPKKVKTKTSREAAKVEDSGGAIGIPKEEESRGWAFEISSTLPTFDGEAEEAEVLKMPTSNKEAEEAKTPKMVRRGDGQRRGGVVERGEVVDLRRRETTAEVPRRESVANLRQREDVARREETPKMRERRMETRRNNSSGSRDAQMRRGDKDNPYESESEKDRNKKKGIREFLGRRKVVAATIAALAVGGLTGAMAARGINVMMQEGEKMERIYDSGEEDEGNAIREAMDVVSFPNALGEEKRKAREMLPGEMVQLDLEQVYASGRYNDEVGSVQGFAVTDKYMVVVNVAREASGDGWVTAMDLDNPWGGYAWESGRLHDVFHGNGATWNSGANEIAIINDEKEIFLDAESGEHLRGMEGGDYAGGGIAHNANGGYITMKGNKIKTTKGEFNVDIPLVFQDIAYNDGYIYVSAWANTEYLVNDGRIEDAEICRNNFEEGSNAIYKYTEDGEFIDAYFIPAGAGEIESLAFGSDGAPYLLFNEAGNYSIQRAANMN